MNNFVHEMLHSSPAALRIEALWRVSKFFEDLFRSTDYLSYHQEYEEGQTAEARFVKGEPDLAGILSGSLI